MNYGLVVGTCCLSWFYVAHFLFPAGTPEEDQASLRRKRSALEDDPTLWPDQRVPFVFKEPFRKFAAKN